MLSMLVSSVEFESALVLALVLVLVLVLVLSSLPSRSSRR
jgi:hypothetical protein